MYESIASLKKYIDELVAGDRHELAAFYSKRFGIPEKVTEQYIKQRVSRVYNMKANRFDRVMRKRAVVLSCIKYLAYVFLVCVRSERGAGSRQDYDLVIDDIQSAHEINRWNELEEEFGKDKTLFISKIAFPEKVLCEHNIFYLKTMHGYSWRVIKNVSLVSIFSDLIFLVRVSLRTGINFVQIHIHYVNDYCYYQTAFSNVNARYLMQDRNLGRTNALKNYLFKSGGGVKSSCVQKNIAQMNGNALYYDIDQFYVFGNKTADDLLELGARIDSIIPVGSFAMESSSNKLLSIDEVGLESLDDSDSVDVLFIGINVVSSKKTDWSGYYESIRWLRQLSEDFSSLVIRIKHHPSWPNDPYENSLIKGSSVEYLDSKSDSYLAARQVKIIVTFGSSMGYELKGHGYRVFFVDPLRNNPLINKFVHDSGCVISDYREMCKVVSQPDAMASDDYASDDFCIQEKNVSNKIYNDLVFG